ncbi:hypothetical protein PAAG_08193 [Paracoccidioides lutzii Pb01]|uniref:Uncharacterized protein n=1 Tax=Paracoccidioides lutzii (strain ATCC MYA-826 / Pb01) TaxID=502779 RepID=C1HBQ2_PARBA|nr:hypothetical protein PAAG_08193 [Paracoccidioides lutzii Pb01]EEH38466.2 hypothetical protein PAAG_08193 [Paracoccidioides lutzii Pb01]
MQRKITNAYSCGGKMAELKRQRIAQVDGGADLESRAETHNSYGTHDSDTTRTLDTTLARSTCRPDQQQTPAELEQGGMMIVPGIIVSWMLSDGARKRGDRIRLWLAIHDSRGLEPNYQREEVEVRGRENKTLARKLCDNKRHPWIAYPETTYSKRTRSATCAIPPLRTMYLVERPWLFWYHPGSTSFYDVEIAFWKAIKFLLAFLYPPSNFLAVAGTVGTLAVKTLRNEAETLPRVYPSQLQQDQLCVVALRLLPFEAILAHPPLLFPSKALRPR